MQPGGRRSDGAPAGQLRLTDDDSPLKGFTRKDLRYKGKFTGYRARGTNTLGSGKSVPGNSNDASARHPSRWARHRPITRRTSRKYEFLGPDCLPTQTSRHLQVHGQKGQANVEKRNQKPPRQRGGAGGERCDAMTQPPEDCQLPSCGHPF